MVEQGLRQWLCHVLSHWLMPRSAIARKRSHVPNCELGHHMLHARIVDSIWIRERVLWSTDNRMDLRRWIGTGYVVEVRIDRFKQNNLTKYQNVVAWLRQLCESYISTIHNNSYHFIPHCENNSRHISIPNTFFQNSLKYRSQVVYPWNQRFHNWLS